MMASGIQVDAEDCPCFGSMGLHQNNINIQNDENLSRLGFSFSQLGRRSVIDVFREIRDKYFGKPELSSNPQRKGSQESGLLDDDGAVTMSKLPVYCKLMILSLLETSDVCSVSQVNSEWREVANDQILWRELLIRDMCKWSSMSYKSHPLIPQVWDHEVLNNENGVDFSELLHEQSSMPKGCSKMHTSKEESQKLDIHSGETSGNPRRNLNTNRGINFKALYIHSSFQRLQDDTDAAASSMGIPGFIKSLWQGGVEDEGEVIITGPGMDSPRTSSIFRSLMWGSDFLKTMGLLPGNRDGIGSGVQVTFKEKVSFKLIALYSGNNRLRERHYGMERLLHSNVVEVAPNQNQIVNEDEFHDSSAESSANSGSSPHEFVLSEAVRLYFAEKAGGYKLVYVVDATIGQKWADIFCNKVEIAAILKGTEPDPNVNAALVSQPIDGNMNASDDPDVMESSNNAANSMKRPLLVLSCVSQPEDARYSCAQVTALLGLANIADRPWRVQDVVVSTMDGIEKGLEWLLRQQ